MAANPINSAKTIIFGIVSVLVIFGFTLGFASYANVKMKEQMGTTNTIVVNANTSPTSSWQGNDTLVFSADGYRVLGQQSISLWSVTLLLILLTVGLTIYGYWRMANKDR